MRKLVLATMALLASACSGERQAEPAVEVNAAAPASTAPIGAGESLVGLYEGASAARRDQLCIVEESDALRFGLVVWGAGQNSCSGVGTATRDGTRLRLAMAGDESCRIDATIEGGEVVLPMSVPNGCAYYCGAGAKLGEARFGRVASGGEAALRAKDLVGESLCGRS